jgi:hypothetical protein
MSSGAKTGAGKLGRSEGVFDLATYAPVAERITLFYRTFPHGRIITEMVSRTAQDVVFRALVYRDANDPHAAATGWAAEREGDGEINTFACLENTETSAIGRALANLGFTAARERPSAEEMAKVSRARARLASARSEDTGVYSLGTAAAAKPSAVAERASDHLAVDGLIADVNALIARAERAGLRPRRAATWRALITSGTVPRETLLRCERRLRLWIHAPKHRRR